MSFKSSTSFSHAGTTTDGLSIALVAVAGAVVVGIDVGFFLLDQAFNEDILCFLKVEPDLLVVGVDKVDSLLVVFVADARVAAGLAHHGDHSMAKLQVLLVGEADGKVQGSLFVDTGERVAFEEFDIEQVVHDFVYQF